MLLFVSYRVSAQSFLGSRTSALCSAELVSEKSILTATVCPATLSRIKSSSIEVAYSPAPFGLQELKTFSFGASSNYSFADIGLFVENYGYELFAQNRVQVVLSRKLFDTISVGFSLNWNSLKIENYGNANSVQANFGLIAPLLKNLDIAFAAHNFTNSRIGSSDELLPSDYLLGVNYSVRDEYSIALSLQKEISYPISLSFGTSFSLNNNLELLFGYNTNLSSLNGGCRISFHDFNFDYSVSKHSELGYTHVFGLGASLSELFKQ